MNFDPLLDLGREIVDVTPGIPPERREEAVIAIVRHAKMVLTSFGSRVREPSPSDVLAADVNMRMSAAIIAEKGEDESGEYCLLIREERNRMADELIEESYEQDLSKAVPNWPVPCPRCKQKTIYHWSVQTRSSDEAATDFFRCLSCGYGSRG